MQLGKMFNGTKHRAASLRHLSLSASDNARTRNGFGNSLAVADPSARNSAWTLQLPYRIGPGLVPALQKSPASWVGYGQDYRLQSSASFQIFFSGYNHRGDISRKHLRDEFDLKRGLSSYTTWSSAIYTTSEIIFYWVNQLLRPIKPLAVITPARQCQNERMFSI